MRTTKKMDIDRQELIITLEFLRYNANSATIVEYIASKLGLIVNHDNTVAENAKMLEDYILQYTSYVAPNEIPGTMSNIMSSNRSPMFTRPAPLNIKIETQPNFNVRKYMGLWYNAARIPQPFDRDTPWETAEYKLNKSGIIKVDNTAYNQDDSIKGEIIGTAEMVDPRNPALLYVSFPTGQPREENPQANYIVHKTDYVRYSIVGSYDGSNLYFLVRNRPIDEGLYRAMIDYAKKLGYNTDLLRQDFLAIEELSD